MAIKPSKFSPAAGVVYYAVAVLVPLPGEKFAVGKNIICQVVERPKPQHFAPAARMSDWGIYKPGL